ncbi:hypothetical protein CYMTET_45379 [Cymbomonas tetramitiformis]|uniref:Uncharacterized protein n=1 Tax=Cymbomonas tetramitiformis TaxID=36881 RepID=A0AAE0EYN0_9CHLO|nr:hypothetical protein CYMTET_45379 [Cymbomonas tetramitiformis]
MPDIGVAGVLQHPSDVGDGSEISFTRMTSHAGIEKQKNVIMQRWKYNESTMVLWWKHNEYWTDEEYDSMLATRFYGDPASVTANDFEARKKKMEEHFLQSVIGSSVNKEEHESLVASHISDKWITLLNLATASKNELDQLTKSPVQGKSIKSSSWYANDLRDVTIAAIANELDLLQDKSAQVALMRKEMIYAQKTWVMKQWRLEALNLKNLPTEMQPLCNLECIYDALNCFHFDVRYMFFALDMAKKAVGLLDHTERKQHYAHYGIVCKGKYLAPIEFKNFCQRLGFIRDVIDEAKNMFTYLVGWAKYPDWYDKHEYILDVFENDTDTYLMVVNGEVGWTECDVGDDPYRPQIYFQLVERHYKFLSARRMILNCLRAITPEQTSQSTTFITVREGRETQLKEYFSDQRLYGAAFTAPPLSAAKWFQTTLDIRHTNRDFEKGFLELLFMMQASSTSEINMTPALLAASRIKEAKTTPDISAEVRAFSAKV